MKAIRLIIITVLVGIGVAATYFYFEYAVRHAITYIWDDLFNTGNERWVVPVVCLPLTLAYFGAQHLLDAKAEKRESHGLGDVPPSTVSNYLKVLAIGFLSLVAGASLGPEAVLVPACIIAGNIIGKALMGSKDEHAIKLSGMAGFTALFAAFFNSFLVGVLSLLLIRRQFKFKLNLRLILLAALASGTTTYALDLLDSKAYVDLPHYSWHLDLRIIGFLLLLAAAGYAATIVLAKAHDAAHLHMGRLEGKSWLVHGLAASIGLSLLYILGGPLVRFTGNESIVPLFKQAADLGYLGLVWLLVIKLIAMGWSKASGYRGGLVFPSVFAASVVVAMAQLWNNDINVIYGLIAVMAGIIAADSKAKVLF